MNCDRCSGGEHVDWTLTIKAIGETRCQDCLLIFDGRWSRDTVLKSLVCIKPRLIERLDAERPDLAGMVREVQIVTLEHMLDQS